MVTVENHQGTKTATESGASRNGTKKPVPLDERMRRVEEAKKALANFEPFYADFDPNHPYKDYDPSHPYISDELEAELKTGRLVEL